MDHLLFYLFCPLRLLSGVCCNRTSYHGILCRCSVLRMRQLCCRDESAFPSFTATCVPTELMKLAGMECRNPAVPVCSIQKASEHITLPHQRQHSCHRTKSALLLRAAAAWNAVVQQRSPQQRQLRNKVRCRAALLGAAALLRAALQRSRTGSKTLFCSISCRGATAFHAVGRCSRQRHCGILRSLRCRAATAFYAVVQQRSLRCRAATAFYAVVQQRSPRCCSEQQRHRMPW